MTFKAEILNASYKTSFDKLDEVINRKFIFTRSKILFAEEQKRLQFFLGLAESCSFSDKAKYTLTKVYNNNDEKVFQITINNNPNCTSYIKISGLDKIKCNIIHHRYWIDREREWFFKTIIAILIGALIGIFANKVGYKQGFKDGQESVQRNIITH